MASQLHTKIAIATSQRKKVALLPAQLRDGHCPDLANYKRKSLHVIRTSVKWDQHYMGPALHGTSITRDEHAATTMKLSEIVKMENLKLNDTRYMLHCILYMDFCS